MLILEYVQNRRKGEDTVGKIDIYWHFYLPTVILW